MKNYKITVVGAGYVGMSISVLLAQNNYVSILDIDIEKINKINNGHSTVEDEYISKYLKEINLNLHATVNPAEAYENSDYIVVATPTNYNPDERSFDLQSIHSVVDDIIKYNNNSLIVIKSTVPIGFTESLRKKYNTNKIIFSPEFLREGMALYDNLKPSRIIIGGEKSEVSSNFLELLKSATLTKDCKTFFMSPSEAEAVKLFSNTFLAMRISFFNELDSFALNKNLNSKNIIEGVSADSRIGNYYNNPSFGYGGYCLPKDTKQLLTNFDGIPQKLISASIESNLERKKFIAKLIIDKNPSCVGIYRLTMKHQSDNIRESSILDIINIISETDINVIVYEPYIKPNYSKKFTIVNDIDNFKDSADIIITNRKDKNLDDIAHKVFTRDIYNTDT